MQISQNKVAVITYTLTDTEGTIIDKATVAEPFSLIQGTGNIIPGLEAALEGKKAGDKINTTIDPNDAYGERNDSLTQVLSKEMFSGVDTIEAGMQFHTQTEQGLSVVTVTDIAEKEVTVDANHPLAGVTLNFEVDIIKVRDATEDELEHGHVHGVGCNH